MKGKYSAAGRRTLLATRAIALLLVAGSGAFFSCTKKGHSVQAAAKRPTIAQVAQTPEAVKGPAAQMAAPHPQQVKADSPQSKAPQPPLAASLRAFGLGQGSSPRIAWDFSLGPLQSSSPAKGDEADALEVARSFMDGLAAGKLDPELLLPSSREALSVLLAPAPQAAAAHGQASPYRLGAISIQGDDASLKVRLASAKPLSDPQCLREEGLLSLRKEGGSWYIEALALEAPKSGSLAFDPSSLARSNDGH